ncbi:MAG: GntR family transcriptional regulator [Acidimicrobiia bacterium]|nr:GntR family transcriptional regulator [Acidimicrobiia bacterium]
MYTTPDPGRTGTRSEAAYAALKDRLLSGDLPLGHRLAEEALAAELSVSRTPIREALSRLHADGLVERHPSGGYTPAPPDLHTARDLYEVRFALEFRALSLPTITGVAHDADSLEALRADWRSFDAPVGDDETNPDFVLLDEDFHVRLACASGNEAIGEFLMRVNERIRLVRMHDFLSAERIERTITQHIDVLDLLLDGRLDAAEDALQAHFQESLGVVEQRVATALARMVSSNRRSGR